LIVPDKLLREEYLAFAEPAFLQYGSCFATEGMLAAYGHGKDWLDAVKLYIEGNLALLEAEIRPISDKIRVGRPQSTYLVWLDCSGLGMGVEELNHFVTHRARLLLSPGSEFSDKTGQFQRVNIATTRDTVAECARRLVAAVRARDDEPLLAPPRTPPQR